jgi:hypothetical protein
MYFAKIKVNQNLSNKVKQLLTYDSYEQQKGIFIIKISKVISKNIGFDEEVESGDDEHDPTTYISFAEFNKKIIIFKAELIDFFPAQSLPAQAQRVADSGRYEINKSITFRRFAFVVFSSALLVAYQQNVLKFHIHFPD